MTGQISLKLFDGFLRETDEQRNNGLTRTRRDQSSSTASNEAPPNVKSFHGDQESRHPDPEPLGLSGMIIPVFLSHHLFCPDNY